MKTKKKKKEMKCFCVHVCVAFVYVNTYFGSLNDICELSNPDKTALGCNQEETIATVQRGRSRLD